VEGGVALARVEGASERGGQFADEAMVWEAQVAKFEGEAYELGEEV
jgi:hypothetical protein